MVSEPTVELQAEFVRRSIQEIASMRKVHPLRILADRGFNYIPFAALMLVVAKADRQPACHRRRPRRPHGRRSGSSAASSTAKHTLTAFLIVSLMAEGLDLGL